MGFIERNEKEFPPDKEREKLAREREEVFHGLLPKVTEERKEDFLRLLPAAQLAGAFNEEHNYYCENYCHGVIRRGLLGIGRRLMERGVIDQETDIFFLKGSSPTLERTSEPRVEGVSQGVPDHVESEHNQHDSGAGGEGKYGNPHQESIAFADHGAPGCARRFYPDTEKTEGRFGEDQKS